MEASPVARVEIRRCSCKGFFFSRLEVFLMHGKAQDGGSEIKNIDILGEHCKFWQLFGGIQSIRE